MSKLRMLYTLNKNYGMSTIVGPARILERLVTEASAAGISPPGGMKRTALINYLHDHLSPNYKGSLLMFRDPNDVRASRSGYVSTLRLAQVTVRKQSKAEKEQAKLMLKAREKKRLRQDAVYQKRSREAAVRAGAVLGRPAGGRFVRAIPQPAAVQASMPRLERQPEFSRPWTSTQEGRDARARLRDAILDEPLIETEDDASDNGL